VKKRASKKLKLVSTYNKTFILIFSCFSQTCVIANAIRYCAFVPESALNDMYIRRGIEKKDCQLGRERKQRGMKMWDGRRSGEMILIWDAQWEREGNGCYGRGRRDARADIEWLERVVTRRRNRNRTTPNRTKSQVPKNSRRSKKRYEIPGGFGDPTSCTCNIY